MQIKKRQNRFLVGALVMGTFAGALAGSAIFSPAPHVSADEGGFVSSSESTVKLNLLPVISIGVEDIDISITPDVAGKYSSGSANVVVDSNSESGYAVYVSTKTTERGLKHSELDSKINIVSADVDLETYQATESTSYNNTWGYVHDNKISTITDTATTKICESAASSMFGSGDRPECTFAVGVRADNTIPSGDYSNTVVFTVIPN